MMTATATEWSSQLVREAEAGVAARGDAAGVVRVVPAAREEVGFEALATTED